MAAPHSWRLKLKRANCHLETLSADILRAGEGDPYMIPVRREDYPDGSAAFVVDRVTQDPDGWGLLLGDAVHDFRCALDHVWWELSCRHLTHEPTEEEAKNIQFPLLKPGGTWDPGNYAKWVGTAVLDPIGKLQPPDGLDPDEIHPLAALRRLSNEDNTADCTRPSLRWKKPRSMFVSRTTPKPRSPRRHPKSPLIILAPAQ